MRQIICIHGGETHGSYEEYLDMLRGFTIDLAPEKKRWRTSLPQVLEGEYNVILPVMPDKYNARYEAWEIWFDKYVPFLEEGCICIGHSLGGIFLARYLALHTLPIRLSALYLVAAPYFTEETPRNGGFTLTPELLLRVGEAHPVVLVHSKDDPIVPFEDMERYKYALLQARTMEFDDRGHFLQEEFPELVSDIRSLPHEARALE